jgi:hypothetical protein
MFKRALLLALAAPAVAAGVFLKRSSQGAAGSPVVKSARCSFQTKHGKYLGGGGDGWRFNRYAKKGGGKVTLELRKKKGGGWRWALKDNGKFLCADENQVSQIGVKLAS